MRFVAVVAQRLFHHVAPCRVDIGIGDDRHVALAQLAPAVRHQFSQQSGADAHFIRPAGHIDGDYSHCSMPWITLLTVLVCGPLQLSTWIGACA